MPSRRIRSSGGGNQYTLQIGAESREGKTDGNGELKENISPVATEAQLFIGKERRELKLSLGELDPLTEVSGIQARLANLGFDPGPVDGELGPRTQAALQDFQEQHDLEPTGAVDDKTIAALKDRHGR